MAEEGGPGLNEETTLGSAEVPAVQRHAAKEKCV
jgi:hypothetical protein